MRLAFLVSKWPRRMVLIERCDPQASPLCKTSGTSRQVAFDRALAETRHEARITQEKIAKFVGVMRTKVLTGETPFRRAYIRAVVDKVEADDNEIRIIGSGPFWNASSWAAGRSGRSAQFCSEVAHPTRFERVAFAFGGRRSIQLSYGCLLLTQCLRGFRVWVKPQRAALASLCITILFLPHFSHQPA
jgi:hypothetical protein